MDANNPLKREQLLDPEATTAHPLSPDDTHRCQILLHELVHLIGLFLIHSHQSKGARATHVLFDQIIRNLAILETIPDHDGSLLIRRSDCRGDLQQLVRPDYMVLFGNVILQGTDPSHDQEAGSAKWPKHRLSALAQAFNCLSEQAIHALYIQLPGSSEENIERLRLALNIIARYHDAVQEGEAITFRHNQRTLTVPVIADHRGLADPNLTLVAALNGLSAANARALISQAAAYHTISRVGQSEDSSTPMCMSSYNQIFDVRSLRSQIVKPPLEVNNLPWLENRELSADVACRENFVGDGDADVSQETGNRPSGIVEAPSLVEPADRVPAFKAEDLAPYLDMADTRITQALQLLREDDYARLQPLDLGRRFIVLTRLLYALDKKCQDPAVIDNVLDLLRRRLVRVSDEVLICLTAKRQGLKIEMPGRTVIVGLVHPRLFDLIALIKEHIVAQQRIEVIKKIAFDFDLCHLTALADGFGLSIPDAHHILNLLKDCFGADGTFHRSVFENQANNMVQHENAIFEILWCFLKETPRREDRLNFLNALQLVMARLKHPKQALQFLLADICQEPAGISYTDRNAFALSTILLHAENKELYVDISRTPDDVLIARRKLSQLVKHYARWRLEIDQVRFGTKVRTIHHMVQQAVARPAQTEHAGFEVTFLLALEREALIFSALVGGHSARILLREALAAYGDADAEIYRRPLVKQLVVQLLDQLQTVVRCLGCAGHTGDIKNLNALGKNARRLMGLVAHPAHRLRVKQVLKYAVKACRAIASRGR